MKQTSLQKGQLKKDHARKAVHTKLATDIVNLHLVVMTSVVVIPVPDTISKADDLIVIEEDLIVNETNLTVIKKDLIVAEKDPIVIEKDLTVNEEDLTVIDSFLIEIGWIGVVQSIVKQTMN